MSASRLSLRLARIHIAGTSRSSRDATNSALTAWCPIRAARSGAGLRRLCWTKRGSWPTWLIRRFNCSGRTLILTVIPMERKALLSCWRLLPQSRGFGGGGLLLLLLRGLGAGVLVGTTPWPRLWVIGICLVRGGLR